jgi:hypothetical protein
VKELASYGVEFSGVTESDWLAQLLSWVLSFTYRW